MSSVMGIQRGDAIPLYHQIYLALRDQIYSGALGYGAQVPTEHDLAAQFGVSRITARRSLKELADNNLVERRRRVGTRVIYRARTVPIEFTPEQAVESLIAFGRDTDVRVMDYVTEAASDALAELLGIAAGDQVVRATRMRSLHGEPLGLIESVVPAAIATGVTRAQLGRKPLLELLRLNGHIVSAGQQIISAVGADPTLAMQLGVEPRAAIIRIERLIRSASGAPLARTIAHYRGDRYRLALDMHAVPHPITI